MTRFVVILLLLLPLFYSASIDCVPRSFSSNSLVAEKFCNNYIGSDCRCWINNAYVICSFDFKDKITVACIGDSCTIKVLDENKSIDYVPLQLSLVGLMCDRITGAKCDCESISSDTVECEIKNVRAKSLCDDTGCTMYIGELSHESKYCAKEESGVLFEKVSNGLALSIEGTVVSEDGGRKKLDNGIISISGPLKRGIEVEMVADIGYVDENSSLAAIHSEVKEEARNLFRKTIREQYGTEDFETIEAIEVNLSNLRDGEHIKSAVVRFKVPKTIIKEGTVVVILRYDDEGRVSVLTPSVREDDAHYIYEVSTDGLSLYAVATINQITGSVAEDQLGEESASKRQGEICGVVGAILLLLGALYTVNEST
ncbi:MAG: PGF-pre-PGF domain-containing protein [Candidatus Micrarchaeia archaeon]